MSTAATLIVMRHAQAGEARAGQADFARELTAQGRVDASWMGGCLKATSPKVARVVSSNAIRARQTVEAALADWQEPPPIIWEPALYLADLTTVLEIVEWTRPVTSLIVGHNPGLEDFLAWLVAERASLSLSPAAAVIVNIPGDEASGETRLAKGCGRLVSRMTPNR